MKMAVPTYPELVEPILRYLAQFDAPVPAGQVHEAMADIFRLTDEDRRLVLGDGKPVYKDRAGWGFNWLKRAGLAEAVANGQWQLTPRGREVARTSLPPNLRARLDAVVKSRSGAPKSRSTRTPITRSALGDRKAYRLPAKPLQTGGQADVYEAIRKTDNRILILKRIRGKVSGKRMRREIDVQSTVKHVNIMPILDWDVVDYSWYVMPKGNRVMSDLSRPLASDLICGIAKSVAAALEVANAAGHPHRDVKPQNIIELVGENGEARWVLADWGLTRRALGETTAKLTKTGQFLGSEGFAPPEAYQDAHNVGLPGDIYSLGQVIAWAAGVDPVPNISPAVGAPWGQVVEKLTQQQAEARPQTIAEVQRLLAEVCDAFAC